jgi:hypothetical protein
MKKNRRVTTLINLIAVILLFTAVRLLLSATGGNRSIETLLTQVCYNIIMVAS